MKNAPVITEIEGKPIKELINLPHGEFLKKAQQIDPLWGIEGDGVLKKFKARVQYEIIKEGEEEIEFEAYNEKHAEVVAREEAKEMRLSEGWDNTNVYGIKEVGGSI